jgi:hypothetical protein
MYDAFEAGVGTGEVRQSKSGDLFRLALFGCFLPFCGVVVIPGTVGNFPLFIYLAGIFFNVIARLIVRLISISVAQYNYCFNNIRFCLSFEILHILSLIHEHEVNPGVGCNLTLLFALWEKKETQ